MPRIPDTDEFNRRWRQLTPADRRRVLRAVNKGQVLDSRKEAALAVIMARRQQRFWRWAWLAGPLLSIPLGSLLGVEGLGNQVAYALFGAGILIAMSIFYTRRAQRAEEGNADHAVHGRRRRD